MTNVKRIEQLKAEVARLLNELQRWQIMTETDWAAVGRQHRAENK